MKCYQMRNWVLPKAILSDGAVVPDLTGREHVCTHRHELERLCQAIEGHRSGSLNDDGLWHYRELALGSKAIPNIHCPYCGGNGDEQWFKTHEHPNPFGDEE